MTIASTLAQTSIEVLGTWNIKSLPKTSLQEVIDMKIVKQVQHV
jgi:hypothetical protein